jgi:hypothetical protein
VLRLLRYALRRSDRHSVDVLPEYRTAAANLLVPCLQQARWSAGVLAAAVINRLFCGKVCARVLYVHKQLVCLHLVLLWRPCRRVCLFV